MGLFGRVAEAFEVAAKMKDCDSSDSSGSEHSPETMMDLSDLVNSFIHSGNAVVDEEDIDTRVDDDLNSDEIDHEMEEMKESLKRLLRFKNGDDVSRKINLDVEKAWTAAVTQDRSSEPSSTFNRQFMSRLRDQGFDAGLCKSKWEKKGRLLSGDHEYIDVNVSGTRYIIIGSLLQEFEIARPTENYTSLLEILPQISVCKVEELKEIVRIMCKSIRISMKQMKMIVPPWRRREYIEAKWFGSYKRTTNLFPTKRKTGWNVGDNKTVGFILNPGTCNGRQKEDYVNKDFGFKVGNLAMVMHEAS